MRKRLANVRLTSATFGPSAASCGPISRPATSRMPKVLNQSGETALTHVMR